MSNPYSNKKKIRGWKKQIRKINYWKNYNLTLDVTKLHKSQRDYVKVTIDPWYRLVRRNPPIWYNRLILEALIEIYLNWHKTLQESGEPFYLKIWLFEHHFINSQVVAATGDWIVGYNNTFTKSNEKRAFPFEKYKIHNFSLENFQWELHVEENYFYEKIDQLSEAEINKIKQKAYRSGFLQNGDRYFAIKTGDVWIGTLHTLY
ncbi:hypothetical protein A4S05_01750 [Nostoc sp. KVJ20]|uniref:hypothetical protein n=1 Tax=Nostoc sp. KVJ20 TaxID=457944 RepID=UPI00083D2455|nr:hypothetical protein [Nostoc sp. KVJ20]ODG97132.1 hypothetical protein A4S05_01750 [Nostoc sp. KVJ20]